MSYYVKPRKKVTKAEAQKLHAKKRAAERFGINVSISRVVKMIQTGQSRFLRKENCRLSHHKIVYDGHEMTVVFDKVRKVPVTFLFDKKPK